MQVLQLFHFYNKFNKNYQNRINQATLDLHEHCHKSQFFPIAPFRASVASVSFLRVSSLSLYSMASALPVTYFNLVAPAITQLTPFCATGHASASFDISTSASVAISRILSIVSKSSFSCPFSPCLAFSFLSESKCLDLDL